MTDERPPWEEPQDTPNLIIEADEPEVTPEDAAAATEALPPLVTAADLAPDPDDEVPPPPGPAIPGERYGPFISQKSPGQGDGTRDLIVNGDMVEPVGIWLARDHAALTPPEVAALLVEMGLPEPRAVYHARHRERPHQAAIDAHPGVAKLVAEEDRHRALKDEFSKAFVQAQSKKERGSKK